MPTIPFSACAKCSVVLFCLFQTNAVWTTNSKGHPVSISMLPKAHRANVEGTYLVHR